MKKTFIFILILFLGFLTSCSKGFEFEDNYDEEEFGYINIEKDSIKIMQLTDMHLAYGFDYLDRKTYKLIDALIIKEEPDLIVVTGDVFMSISGKRLFKKFIKFMDSYEIPWTFTFGNHEDEYHNKEIFVEMLMEAKTEYLYFHYGPILSSDKTHGYSNFKLKIMNNENPVMNLYLLDTKADRTDGVEDSRYPYDYLTLEQVAWFKENLENDLVASLAFMHIPLKQYENYDGEEQNETIWSQGEDTGFFQAILDNSKKTLGIFVGHDHLNSFTFYYEDILLGYGLSSGYNAYGTSAKGARIIKINYFGGYNYDLDTYLVYDYEVLS